MENDVDGKYSLYIEKMVMNAIYLPNRSLKSEEVIVYIIAIKPTRKEHL